LWSIFWLPS
jgi:hypothetical protein